MADLVEKALPPGDEAAAVIADLYRQIDEYHARPPREIGGGELVQELHGVVWWLYVLQGGGGSLPEVIPLSVLKAYRNGHAKHPAKASPVPLLRCVDCLMILPNNDESGEGFGAFGPCPVCGSDRIQYADLSKPGYNFRPYKE